ncbi:MAG: hypothetical protein E7255_10365 [Lachnospiraceae bacterium]|nr:hypothetical protein [Lachnospiraceae bacterium]
MITSIQYLDTMEYTKDIDWLETYADAGDFEKIFGFSQFDEADKNLGIYRYHRIVSNTAATDHHWVSAPALWTSTLLISQDSFIASVERRLVSSSALLVTVC